MTRRNFLDTCATAAAVLCLTRKGHTMTNTVPFQTRLPVTQLYCEQPQPCSGYLYDFVHVKVRNARGDHFVVPYNFQFGDSFTAAKGRMSRALYTDGPRGIGHTTPYISGAVLPSGDLIFVETSPRGRVSLLALDGSVETLVGYRLKADVIPYNPYDLSIPDALVKDQYEHVGSADIPLNLPTDIQPDPLDPDLFYIADSENNRIALLNRRTRTIRTYAGMSGIEAHIDGPWMSAAFHYPTSLAVLPDRSIYVADQGNHAIRKITREGIVSTVIGAHPLPNGLTRPQESRFNSYTRVQTRAWRVDGPTSHATLLYPLCIRADSHGRLLILEPWFSSIRRYDPVTGTLTTLRDLPGSREWQWLDCDTQGTCGPRDDIFGAHMLSNITRVYGDGSGTQELMPGSNYFPATANQCMSPHYPWMVAVGGGSIWCNGFGTMGVTRIRQKQATDYVDTPADITRYKRGQKLWLRGDDTSPAGISAMPGCNLTYGRFGIDGLLDIPESVLSSPMLCLHWLQTMHAFSGVASEDIRFFLCKHRGIKFA